MPSTSPAHLSRCSTPLFVFTTVRLQQDYSHPSTIHPSLPCSCGHELSFQGDSVTVHNSLMGDAVRVHRHWHPQIHNLHTSSAWSIYKWHKHTMKRVQKWVWTGGWFKLEDTANTKTDSSAQNFKWHRSRERYMTVQIHTDTQKQRA